jgi:hypothetical protein
MSNSLHKLFDLQIINYKIIRYYILEISILKTK